MYLQESNKRYGYELKEVKLKKELIVDARQHYVIQHTHYSTFVKQFRTALFETASFFNNAMQHHLIPKVKGTPFPELEDPLLVLAEPKPVIALKQIHNSLYYIEQVILQLEQLNNKSWETAYVYHLFGAYTHLVNLHKAIEGLSVDSHVKLISNDLLNKAQTLLATIQEHSEPYQTAPETLSTEPIEFGGLWYCLNAFYVSPKHIRALRNTNYLTGAELDQLHQQAKHSAVTIEYLLSLIHI